MPPASQSSETSAAAAAAAADEADSVREHAHHLVAMADMTIRSTEKVERKAVDGNFDESAVDFLLDGSDASNLDLGKDEEDASEDKEGTTASSGKSDGKGGGSTAKKAATDDGGDNSDGVEYGTADEDDGLDGIAPPSTSSSSRRSSKKATRRRSSKKKDSAAAGGSGTSPHPTSPGTASTASADGEGEGDGDDATTATDSVLSLGGLSTANAPISDNASAETLREQLTQTRRALLQVRENAKLKHRKLELEHTTVKKELKKAKGRSSFACDMLCSMLVCV